MAVDHKKGLEKLFKDLFAGIGKGFLIYLNITLLAAAFLVGFGFGVVFGLSVAFNFGTWPILYILAITTTSSGLIIWDCNRRHHIYDQALTSTRDEMLVWSLLCSIAGLSFGLTFGIVIGLFVYQFLLLFGISNNSAMFSRNSLILIGSMGFLIYQYRILARQPTSVQK